MKVVFTKSAERQWEKLSVSVKKQMREKLVFYFSQSNPLSYARKMRGRINEYRFRIGDWRVICIKEKHTINIAEIGRRDSIYK